MSGLYRWTSLIWIFAAVALGLYAHDTTLLRDAGALRVAVPVLALVVALAMAVRLFVPYHPEWTRWTLLLMGTLSVCTTILSVFGAEGLGYTWARLGVIGMCGGYALFAYTHWVGESLYRADREGAQ